MAYRREGGETLEGALGRSAEVTAEFEAELARMRKSMTQTSASVASLSGSISNTLGKAFDGLVFDGMKLSDALRNVAGSIAQATFAAAMKPVTQQLGGALAQAIGSVAGFAQGGAFSQGRVMPFAKGGVVSAPVTFPMRGGTGLMGEAGPEAILPLRRGADGSLGVQAQTGARPVQVVMNITTPDAAGFRRSQGQIAAEMGRALQRGQRNR